jgi:hypothetical protein
MTQGPVETLNGQLPLWTTYLSLAYRSDPGGDGYFESPAGLGIALRHSDFCLR